MPIYMDLHIVPGITAEGAAEAHRKDLAIQKEYGCICMTYWVDEKKDSAFCLIDAPNAEAVRELHNEAHGLMTYKILEVNSTVVESFLGRIYDPATPEILDGQLKIFNDPAFRILVLVQTIDPVLLIQTIGHGATKKLVEDYQNCIDLHSNAYGGEVSEHNENLTILSFTSAFKAVDCASSILNTCLDNETRSLNLKISINSGMPLTLSQSDRIFGDTISLGQHLLYAKKTKPIQVSTKVWNIIGNNLVNRAQDSMATLSPVYEHILDKMLNVLKTESQHESFNCDVLCEKLLISRSSLNRISRTLTGISPNALLNTYRLDKALHLLNKQEGDISKIAYAVGFGSPSYFSKCFKKQFGLTPSTYMSQAKKYW